MQKQRMERRLWIAIYFILIFTPLLILLLAPRPAGRTFWRELSVSLGFAGLALMGLQFIPTARLPLMSEAFPMDVLYDFSPSTLHRGFYPDTRASRDPLYSKPLHAATPQHLHRAMARSGRRRRHRFAYGARHLFGQTFGLGPILRDMAAAP